MRKKLGNLLPLSLIILVVLPLATLSRVPADSQAVIRDGFGAGSARVLGPGWHFRIPLAQVIHRYPAGTIHLEGVETLTSSEGVGLSLPYVFKARIDPNRLLDFDDHARGRNTGSFLQEVIRRSLSAWVSGESAARWTHSEAVSAPPSVTGELRALGMAEVTLTLGGMEAPPETERAAALASVKKRTRDTGRKIVLVGLDGADWQLIDPWIREGKLPTLERLKQEGAWANLKAMQPMLSPLLWTTVATGRRPEEHGVVDFLVRDSGSGQKVPISSRFRKVEALWNIFSDLGRRVGVVAWWASWPAEPVKGHIVSDRVSYSLFGYQDDAERLPGVTHPADYFSRLRSRLITDTDITLDELREFVDITAAEFQERRTQIDRANPRQAYSDPVNHLTRILASTRNYHAATLDLLAQGQPDLLMVYFQGIDEVSHRFAHMMPPRMAMVSEEEYGKFHGAVEAFYRYQDRILADIVSRLDPATLVLVLSDHGFKNGPARPTDDPPYIEGKPGKWHRMYGIFLLSGSGIRPGALDTVSLLDIAPTVLAVAGIPPSQEMSGRVLTEAFLSESIGTLQTERVPTYEFGPRMRDTRMAGASSIDEEMIESLRSLGYIGGGGEGSPDTEAGTTGELSGNTVTYHSNLAALHLKAQQYDLAQQEVEAALTLVPDYIPALMTQASLYEATRRPEEALGVYQSLAEAGKAERGVFNRIAKLYETTGRTGEGIAYLSRFSQEGPRAAEIITSLGILFEAKGDTNGGEALFRRALAVDPAAGEAAARLYEILKRRGEANSLEPVVAQALEINENSVAHHNLMGLLAESGGDLARAERHFRRAVELDPDYSGVLANLGALYARTGRSREAIQVLTRAVEKEPGNYEARMNLGAALGKAGEHEGAIRQFEEIRRRGFRSSTLYNGLAIAYHETGQFQKCIQNLRQSLDLDPNQPEVRAMLAEVESESS